MPQKPFSAKTRRLFPLPVRQLFDDIECAQDRAEDRVREEN